MPNARRSKLVQLPLPIDVEEEWTPMEVVEEVTEEVVSVVLARHKIVNVTGKFTGRKYRFSGAGSIVENVNIQDAQFLVNQPLPPSCCGSIPTPQFLILGR